MALVIVNPSPRAKHQPKRTPPPPARKAASKGASMAKRRSAAQKAATRRMLAANPHRRRRRNPAPVHHRYHKVARRRNPAPRHFRRRRNPETGGSLFKELMSKEGLMQVAVIAGMPTLTELLTGYVASSSTGYVRPAIKGGLGLALAWALYKFVSKKVGMTAGLVAVGTMAAEEYHVYSAGGVLTAATPTQSGYLGAYNGRASGGHHVMKGYRQAEPGVVYL